MTVTTGAFASKGLEPVVLDPVAFRDVYIAMLKAQVHNLTLANVMLRAGLDPTFQYDLDEAAQTATPRLP